MKPYKKYQPYIRRMNGKEKGEDFRTAVRLNASKIMEYKYVLVQHGFPNIACEVGISRKDIQDRIIGAGRGKRGLKKWAKRAQQCAVRK
jgi:hypothetical protein